MKLDFWIPVAGLLMASVGAAFAIASLLSPKKKLLDVPAPLEPAITFAEHRAAYQAKHGAECGVCGLAHGSDAALDGDKQACVDALLALVPKRGEHGRFAKRA